MKKVQDYVNLLPKDLAEYVAAGLELSNWAPVLSRDITQLCPLAYALTAEHVLAHLLMYKMDWMECYDRMGKDYDLAELYRDLSTGKYKLQGTNELI